MDFHVFYLTADEAAILDDAGGGDWEQQVPVVTEAELPTYVQPHLPTPLLG